MDSNRISLKIQKKNSNCVLGCYLRSEFCLMVDMMRGDFY